VHTKLVRRDLLFLLIGAAIAVCFMLIGRNIFVLPASDSTAPVTVTTAASAPTTTKATNAEAVKKVNDWEFTCNDGFKPIELGVGTHTEPDANYALARTTDDRSYSTSRRRR
jgi:hypothetical protein